VRIKDLYCFCLYCIAKGRFTSDQISPHLAPLDEAEMIDDMVQLGWDLHPLKGDLDGHWLVKVNGNWRMAFAFEDGDAYVVDYQNYHKR